jgi:hypothetical protein
MALHDNVRVKMSPNIRFGISKNRAFDAKQFDLKNKRITRLQMVQYLD